MRKYGAFLIEDGVYRTHEQAPGAKDLDGATVDPVTSVINKGGQPVGVEIDGRRHIGFPTPSRKLEFFSNTLKSWKWPDQAVPNYIRSHVHWSNLDRAKGEMVLLPTFRLPTLIHTRSGNAKWLYEISHTNPLWMHPEDAARAGVATGDLLKVSTRIGHFVDRVWVTEAIRPGVIACSHHLGRWRLHEDAGGERWSTSLVDLAQPDPVSGQHCWHQKVTVSRPGPDDRYGDVFVDTNRSFEVYREWLALARPAPGPGNLRRPLWLPRAFKPDESAYRLDGA